MSRFKFVRWGFAPLLTLALGLVLAPPLSAQTGTVRGRVTAAGTLQPLAGAQVLVVGTGRGSLTSSAGEYLIVGVPAGSRSVRVQMLGYGTESQAVTVGDGQAVTANFELANQAIALDEVVVTGAGVVATKKSLGQTVTSVNATEFQEAPIANVSDALAGRVPGMVGSAAGETGQGTPIRLRGTISLSQRNGPLIYVDGVRVDNRMESFLAPGSGNAAVATSRLNDLNPNNIDRVEVLKGAAAATLFGTEASAGVIQIFTKRGINGAPQFDFSVTQQALFMPDRIPDNVAFDRASGQILRNAPADDYVRTGHHQQYYLSARGGTDQARYFASGWWKGEDGIFPTNSLDNMGVNVGIDLSPMPKLQSQMNLEIIKNDLAAPYPSWGLIGEFTLADPRNVTPQRPYGELFYTVDGALAYNNTEAVDRYTVSTTQRYDWAEGLRSQATLGYNTIRQQGTIYIEYGRGLRDPNGVRDITDTQRQNITLDLSTSWEQAFGSNLISTLTLGGQSFWETASKNRAAVNDYPAPGLATLRGGKVSLVEEDYTEVINAGLFAQEQIGINDRVFLTAGIRIDGNSAFGDDFGFQTYPKAGISYAVSEEPWFQVGLFDQLRLRAAYGTSGLQPGAYDALRTWRAYSLLNNNPVLLPYAVGNTELKPERSTEIEFGVDASFFDNRAGLELTYFQQQTDDAILRRNLAPSNGFLEPQFVNVGELQSRGIEAVLDLTAVETAAYRLGFNASFSKIDQEIADMGGVAPIKISSDTRRWNYHREGYQPGAVIAPKLDASNPYRTTVPIGDVTRLNQIVANTIKDASGADSLIFMGNQLPTTTGTLSTDLDLPRWNLSLRALFRGEAGFVMLDQTNLIRTQVFITEDAARFEQELANPATSAQRKAEIAAEYAHMSPQVHSNWLRDGDNVRFQEASVTWRVPSSVGGWLRNASVTLAGRNLALWTAYDGIGDPGSSSTPTVDFTQNVDYFAAPIPRRLELTIRTSF